LAQLCVEFFGNIHGDKKAIEPAFPRAEKPPLKGQLTSQTDNWRLLVDQLGLKLIDFEAEVFPMWIGRLSADNAGDSDDN